MSLYENMKGLFLKAERELEKDERIMLTNAKYFFVFCVFMITAMLVYYSSTGDEFFPFFALGLTAIVFWLHSDKTGKIFMIAAASIGYIHEVLGTMEGWFVYQSGFFFQTPVWLIPGYAAMFWACYNLWKQSRKRYKLKEKNFRLLAVATIALIFILDASLYTFRPLDWAYDIVFIGIILLLFRAPADRHLAYITFLLTAFDELLGYSLGAWQHYMVPGQVSTLNGFVDTTASGFATNFSFTGITASYLLFLWGAIKFAEFVQKGKLPPAKDFMLLGGALAIKTYTWTASSLVIPIVLKSLGL